MKSNKTHIHSSDEADVLSMSTKLRISEWITMRNAAAERSESAAGVWTSSVLLPSFAHWKQVKLWQKSFQALTENWSSKLDDAI